MQGSHWSFAHIRLAIDLLTQFVHPPFVSVNAGGQVRTFNVGTLWPFALQNASPNPQPKLCKDQPPESKSI